MALLLMFFSSRVRRMSSAFSSASEALALACLRSRSAATRRVLRLLALSGPPLFQRAVGPEKKLDRLCVFLSCRAFCADLTLPDTRRAFIVQAVPNQLSSCLVQQFSQCGELLLVLTLLLADAVVVEGSPRNGLPKSIFQTRGCALCPEIPFFA